MSAGNGLSLALSAQALLSDASNPTARALLQNMQKSLMQTMTVPSSMQHSIAVNHDLPQSVMVDLRAFAGKFFGFSVKVHVDRTFEHTFEDPHVLQFFARSIPPSPSVRTTYEVTLEVFPDDEEEATARIDEFRERLATEISGWRAIDFGVALEIMNDE